MHMRATIFEAIRHSSACLRVRRRRNLQQDLISRNGSHTRLIAIVWCTREHRRGQESERASEANGEPVLAFVPLLLTNVFALLVALRSHRTHLPARCREAASNGTSIFGLATGRTVSSLFPDRMPTSQSYRRVHVYLMHVI